MHPVLARHAPATQLMARSQRTQLAPPKPHESESTPATHCPALSQQPAQLVVVQRSIVRTAPQLETRNRASNIMKRRDMEPRCWTVEGLSPTEVWMLPTCGRRCTTADGPHPRRSHRDGASARRAGSSVVSTAQASPEGRGLRRRRIARMLLWLTREPRWRANQALHHLRFERLLRRRKKLVPVRWQRSPCDGSASSEERRRPSTRAHEANTASPRSSDTFMRRPEG